MAPVPADSIGSEELAPNLILAAQRTDGRTDVGSPACARVQVGAVLNRPTANLVQFHTDGKPRRCISFGGDGRLRGAGLDIDSNGLMWLGQAATLDAARAEPLGSPMGGSGLRRVPAMQAAESIKAGATASNTGPWLEHGIDLACLDLP